MRVQKTSLPLVSLSRRLGATGDSGLTGRAAFFVWTPATGSAAQQLMRSRRRGRGGQRTHARHGVSVFELRLRLQPGAEGVLRGEVQLCYRRRSAMGAADGLGLAT